MRLTTCLRYFYLAYFSKPVGERVLYRAIRRTRARKILEIGIGDVARTLRMIQLARRFSDGEPVRYAAIDLFEARPATSGQSLSLKQAHRLLHGTQAQIQLIPGEPAQALARVANSLPNVDLVLVSAQHGDASLAEAWFYFPRMLHGGSAVYRERADTPAGTTLERLEAGDIETRAATGRRRAA
ncbi:MAG: hypothetical protein WD063_13195 [Pirellulales bacterium]